MLLITAAFSLYAPASAASGNITLLNVKGTINPVLTDYIERGIDRAESQSSACVVIQLDTPGGLDTTMRDIIQTFDRATVPIVVYVPPGARAASAGFFLTIASDIAAMAPDTAIGAATPVSLSEDLSEEMQNKITNDAVAYARAIATTHNRNADWAESAVREGASLPASEALGQGVIEIVAQDFGDLLSQLDGFQYQDTSGDMATLSTAGAEVAEFRMTAVESFLYAIADPNIAYLLLTLAMLGIVVEVFNPGLIIPGAIGVVSGITAFFAMGMLPVNIAGVILILLAFALFIAEAFTTSFGLLTAGGAASLIAGSLILFKEGGPLFEVDIWLVITVTILLAAAVLLVGANVIKTYRRKVATGQEDMAGHKAVVRTALTPNGTVFLEGEIWSAELDNGRAEPGEEVVVVNVEGLKLKVAKKIN